MRPTVLDAKYKTFVYKCKSVKAEQDIEFKKFHSIFKLMRLYFKNQKHFENVFENIFSVLF